MLATDKCDVILVSGAAIGLFFQSQLTDHEKARFDFRTRVFDSGALQPHAFTVDMDASLDEYMQLGERDREEQLLACPQDNQCICRRKVSQYQSLWSTIVLHRV